MRYNTNFKKYHTTNQVDFFNCGNLIDTMRNNMILLVTVILLHVISSLILQAIYGPSYGFMSGEDCWVPDGKSGWVEHGKPDEPPPPEPSVNVPVGVRYIPLFLPAIVLILFLFTPLSRKLESKETEEEMAISNDPDSPESLTDNDITKE